MASIVRTDDVLGGEPRIENTRVGVLDVYELVVGSYDPADVADQLDRSLAEIYTALAWYYDHPEEMRRLRRDREQTKTTLAADALEPPEPAQ